MTTSKEEPPEGFQFGKETSQQHIKYRVAWERWREAELRAMAEERTIAAAEYLLLADAHARTREAYERLLSDSGEP